MKSGGRRGGKETKPDDPDAAGRCAKSRVTEQTTECLRATFFNLLWFGPLRGVAAAQRRKRLRHWN